MRECHRQMSCSCFRGNTTATEETNDVHTYSSQADVNKSDDEIRPQITCEDRRNVFL